MKSFESILFLEKGYGQFPYIIIRGNHDEYKQIPIHRSDLLSVGLEGTFIAFKEEVKVGFLNACIDRFNSIWYDLFESGNPMDIYLDTGDRYGSHNIMLLINKSIDSKLDKFLTYITSEIKKYLDVSILHSNAFLSCLLIMQ